MTGLMVIRASFGGWKRIFFGPSAPARNMAAFTRMEIITRVELILLVIAILVAVVCPQIFNHGGFSSSGARSPLASIKTALDSFQVDTGYYPAGTNGLLDLVLNPAGTANWHGPHLNPIPKDPWGRDYQYACPGKHNVNAYDLWSLGPPDGAPGPHEMIGNWPR